MPKKRTVTRETTDKKPYSRSNEIPASSAGKSKSKKTSANLTWFLKVYKGLDDWHIPVFKSTQQYTRAKHILYPGSDKHLTASLCFPDVTYVDCNKKLEPVFKDELVLKWVHENKMYSEEQNIIFLCTNFETNFAKLSSFDLMISACAGIVSEPCCKYVKPGGYFLVSDAHFDARTTFLRQDFGLEGVYDMGKGKFLTSEADLSGHFHTKEGKPLTKSQVEESMEKPKARSVNRQDSKDYGLSSSKMHHAVSQRHYRGADEPEMCGLSTEKQLIQQMIRTETKVDLMLQEIRKTEERVLSTIEQCKKDTGEKTVDVIKDTQTAQANLLADVKANQEILTKRVSALTVPVVAFVARDLKNGAIDNGETLVFSTIVFNNGSSYDKQTGIFTVPVSGMYQFVVRLCMFVDSFAYINIVSEDVIIVRTRLVDEGTQYHSCSGVTGFAVLDSGKRVWVTSEKSSDMKENVWNHPSLIWNSFSGVLISASN